MAETATLPVAGQRYSWKGLTYAITRVARDGSWADIQVEGVNGWTKRQPLPSNAAALDERIAAARPLSLPWGSVQPPVVGADSPEVPGPSQTDVDSPWTR